MYDAGFNPLCCCSISTVPHLLLFSPERVNNQSASIKAEKEKHEKLVHELEQDVNTKEGELLSLEQGAVVLVK